VPDKERLARPGPGFYQDQNKWNKRTYNLKFLNLSRGEAAEEIEGGANRAAVNPSPFTSQSLDN